MEDIHDLYQEMILDHNRHPRNCRRIEHAGCSAEGYNPLCGDRVKVFVDIEGGVIKDASFEGSGCAISTASASLMTEAVKGKTVEQAKALFRRFHHMVMGDSIAAELGNEADSDAPPLGKLEVFSGVGKYPARVKCATLAWHTVNAALDHSAEPITTE